jgi:carbohydrate kinase (thermoresistant glucokinase family)
MGVSGSGKSTIGAAIADALAVRFVDGDSLHSPASVERMQSGIPLTDDDRWPWLDRIGAELADAVRSPAGVVIACSALKRAYRDRIRAAAPAVRFVFLEGSRETIEARMATRSGHYMPTSLLASQLATLERPNRDERDVVTLSIESPVADVVDAAVRALAASAPDDIATRAP